MNWLRTAASAYSNVLADPDWPKFEIIEQNKVVEIFPSFLLFYFPSMSSLTRKDSINRLPLLPTPSRPRQATNL